MILSRVLLLVILPCIYSRFEVSCAVPAEDIESLIVGGRRAKPGEIAYQLSVQTEYGFHYCGASLVAVETMQVAISAAHCFRYGSSSPIYLIAGELDLEAGSGSEQRRLVSRVVIHPEFRKGAPVANDIALLFLEDLFELNENVSAIVLPSPSFVEKPLKLVVSGWGRLSHGGPTPSHLQIVEIPVIEDKTCQASWNQNETWVLDSMLCAGTPMGDLSPCNGDSGGPAIDKKNDDFLAGIVSFGANCGDPELPAVFTEVAYFVPWIEDQVKFQLANLTGPGNY